MQLSVFVSKRFLLIRIICGKLTFKSGLISQLFKH